MTGSTSTARTWSTTSPASAPPTPTDLAGDEKRARNAVSSVNKAGLLIGAPTDDRFEISEAIESLLPLELLQELLASLRQTNDTSDEADDALFDGPEPEQREESDDQDEERA